MRILIKLEEFLMLLLGVYLFSLLDYSWWWFAGLILAPDIGMLGYLMGDKAGAMGYNLFHHKGLAIAIYFIGVYLSLPLLQLIGVILFSHASLDRVLGYGLKYNKGFKYTHLGEIGRTNE
ncbi:DUF4260 family protein [Arenibacter aquaticus]|uniref:DUF4260 family protein n=1 Tax=Arenibacter aquaticus TaxID=2489054 RepID=A0A3S0CR36_9FLAO|nr:DUF4260 domain-containing protein [Arenibacter aquaticus]RTE55104.1 DUF4260 family protein [Arenibacter aquaticus]